jgi:2,3-dihydroxybenzoate-AMP ligase
MNRREELAQEYLAKGYWKGITVSRALDQAVERYPDRLALVQGEWRLTYQQMGLLAERLALGFWERGLGPGDVVTVQMPNWVEFVLVHYALAKLGAITLPVIPLYRRKEMGHILGFSRSVAYVLPSDFGGFDYLSMLKELRPGLPHLKEVFVVGERVPEGAHSIQAMLVQEREGEGGYPPGYLSRPRSDHRDVACMVVTGGTTGQPKGVPRTHNELISHCYNWTKVLGATPESAFLVPIPVTHVFGLVEGVYIPLCNGAKLVLMDRFEPQDALRLIQREGVTLALLVPALIVTLLNFPRLEEYDTSTLKVIVTGGGPCPQEVITQAKARLGCDLISEYGMSEGPLSTTVLGDPPEVVSTSVGTPHCEGAEFKIVDEQRREVAPGQAGELAFRGPTLFAGYFEQPQETAEAFDQEGWFYTGDLCFQDQHGNLHIVGRKKDTIKRGGETIIPREIEELLYTHPKVLHAAVIGMPDQRLGERVCAYVVPRGGEVLTLHEIVSFLRAKGIATFKLPERLELVQELPITPPSKIQKNVLREDILRKLQAEGKLSALEADLQ